MNDRSAYWLNCIPTNTKDSENSHMSPNSWVIRDMADTLKILKHPRTGSLAWRFCSNRDTNCGCKMHAQSCFLNRTLSHHERLILMPKGKKPQSSSWTPTSFVKCELTEADKKKFRQWIVAEEKNFDTLLTDVVQTGHKLSLSFNDNTDSFIASVTGKPEGCDNANKCYTSHGKDYVTAMWVALFKFHVIWRGEPWEDVGEAEDFG